jgi:hypothetical protein
MNKKISEQLKVFCFYYPQFHSIQQNNEWWGEGFSDWVNVKKSKPLFKDHYQPRIPLDKRYYDLSKRETIKWQVDLAKAYGISGFAHYHYWFDGIQLLEKPTNIFLKSKELDMPFCLVWANETWSRRWDGRDHHILQLQTHKPDKNIWKSHFKYLIHAWLDERAIKINDKPVFIIYRPYKIHDLHNMLDYWRESAFKYGIQDLYFITMKQHFFPQPEDYLYSFDAVIKFQPFDAMTNFIDNGSSYIKKVKKILPKHMRALLNKAYGEFKYIYNSKLSKPTIWDYNKVWNQIILNESIKNTSPYKTYPGAFIDWDNSPRYGNRSKVFDGASPERFLFWMNELTRVIKDKGSEPIIFLNAWNEWAEGTYLEPDSVNEYKYLEAIKSCISSF